MLHLFSHHHRITRAHLLPLHFFHCTQVAVQRVAVFTFTEGWPTRRAHAAHAECERSREADTRPHRGPAVGKRVGDRGSRTLGARLHQRQRHHRHPEVWHDCARCTACTIEPQQHPLLIDSLAASLLPTRYQASCCASCSGFAARLTGRSCTSLRGRAASHSSTGIYCSYPKSRTAADG